MAAARRVALVIGAQGALGRAVVARFNSRGWVTVGIDLSANPECAFSVAADPSLAWRVRQETIDKALKSLLPG